MKNHLIFLFAFLLLSCGQNKPDQQKAVEEQTNDSIQKYDLLKWEDLKINGEIPLLTNQMEIKMKLDKPDSISDNLHECGMYFWNRDYKRLFIDGLEFEATSDSVIFRSIDFRNSNAFLSASKFRLDKNTTVEEIRNYFPNSFKYIRKGLFSSKELECIEVQIGNEYPYHESLRLFLDEKKLVKIDYWIDC